MSLDELGPSGANLIPQALAGGERQACRFALSARPAGYTITAVPVMFGESGGRTFCSDETLVIHESYGPEPATANSPAVPSVER